MKVGVIGGLEVWGVCEFNFSMLLENVKWWLLVAKVIRFCTPIYGSPGDPETFSWHAEI